MSATETPKVLRAPSSGNPLVLLTSTQRAQAERAARWERSNKTGRPVKFPYQRDELTARTDHHAAEIAVEVFLGRPFPKKALTVRHTTTEFLQIRDKNPAHARHGGHGDVNKCLFVGCTGSAQDGIEVRGWLRGDEREARGERRKFPEGSAFWVPFGKLEGPWALRGALGLDPIDSASVEWL